MSKCHFERFKGGSSARERVKSPPELQEGAMGRCEGVLCSEGWGLGRSGGAPGRLRFW